MDKQLRGSSPCDDHGLFQLAGEFCGQLVVYEAGFWEGVSFFSRFIALMGIYLVQDTQQTQDLGMRGIVCGGG